MLFNGSSPLNKKVAIFFLYWLPVIIDWSIIFCLSGKSNISSPVSFPYADKIMHTGEYFILALLIARLLNHYWGTSSPTGTVVLSIFFTLLYAMTDEVHQHFVPLRTPEFFDLIADGLGAFLGTFVYRKAKS